MSSSTSIDRTSAPLSSSVVIDSAEDKALSGLMMLTDQVVKESSPPSWLIPREIRATLRELTQLSISGKHAEIVRIASETLAQNGLSAESKGALLHKLGWAFFNQKEVRCAKVEVLKALDLNLSDGLQKRFLPLRRKIDEADKIKTSSIASGVKRSLSKPPSRESAGQTPPGKKKRFSKLKKA